MIPIVAWATAESTSRDPDRDVLVLLLDIHSLALGLCEIPHAHLHVPTVWPVARALTCFFSELCVLYYLYGTFASGDFRFRLRTCPCNLY
jgi:vacuolar-type H+-ATPase subunit B/Vma2